MVDAMEKETRTIRQEVLKLCWYMRGGLTYEEGMQLNQSERDIINEIVKDNLETTKKSGMPFFWSLLQYVFLFGKTLLTYWELLSEVLCVSLKLTHIFLFDLF